LFLISTSNFRLFTIKAIVILNDIEIFKKLMRKRVSGPLENDT